MKDNIIYATFYANTSRFGNIKLCKFVCVNMKYAKLHLRNISTSIQVFLVLLVFKHFEGYYFINILLIYKACY